MFRWRKDQFDDLKARMDWCVKAYDSANHNPVAVIDNITDKKIRIINSKPGKKLKFDASGSYDDTGQKISFSWFIYPEAGTYKGKIELKNDTSSITQLTVPEEAGGKQIHLILNVSDNSTVAMMHDYRRIVINVNESPFLNSLNKY